MSFFLGPDHLSVVFDGVLNGLKNQHVVNTRVTRSVRLEDFGTQRIAWRGKKNQREMPHEKANPTNNEKANPINNSLDHIKRTGKEYFLSYFSFAITPNSNDVTSNKGSIFSLRRTGSPCAASSNANAFPF
jgi:hypothetical protein